MTDEINFSLSSIKWSEGTTIITGSEFVFCIIYLAAKTIAGAVFFATGSDKTTGEFDISDNCILMLEECFVFVMLIISDAQPLSLS